MGDKKESWFVLLPPVVVGILFLCYNGLTDCSVWSDLALTELQLHQLGEGRILYFGLHSRDGMFHLGPSMFYALYPGYWACSGTTSSLYLSGLLVNSIALAGCAILLARFSPRLGWIGTVAIIIGTCTLEERYLLSFYNVHLLIWWMLLLILLCSVMAEGKFSYMPWAAGVSSFVVQLHFSAVVPALLMCTTGVILAWLYGGRPTWRQAFTTAVVLIAFWILPVLEWTNLNNVMTYFLTKQGQISHDFFSEMSRALLPSKFLRDLIPAGLEWISVVFPLLGLTACCVWAWKHNREAALLGIMAFMAIIGLATGLVSCPRQFWGYYFLAWEWSVGTVVTICVLGVVSSFLTFKLWFSRMIPVIALLTVVLWIPSLNVHGLGHYTFPDNQARLLINKNFSIPRVEFDRAHPWESSVTEVVHMYKRGEPFQTPLWKWPFNLPATYKCTSEKPPVSMWSDCKSNEKP